MKKIIVIILSSIVAILVNANPSGIALQQQVSPLHNLLHVEIDLTNIDSQTFDNVVATVSLPEESLYFIRTDFINSGNFFVTGNFFNGGQTITWATGNDSQANKQFHFFVFAHAPGTFELTVDVTDNQGVPHFYASNSQTLHFPNVENTTFVIPKNGSIEFNATDTFNLTPPATTPVRVAVRPNGLYGTATPSSTTASPYAITYTPNVDFVGYDYFTLQAIDANGDADGESVLMVVGIDDGPKEYAAFLRKTYNPEPEDKAPGAKDFSLTCPVDTQGPPVYLIDYSLDLFNATLPISYSIDTTGITYGTATLIDGIFTYVAGNETGTDAITYQVVDAKNRFTNATITINVIPFS